MIDVEPYVARCGTAHIILKCYQCWRRQLAADLPIFFRARLNDQLVAQNKLRRELGAETEKETGQVEVIGAGSICMATTFSALALPALLQVV